MGRSRRPDHLVVHTDDVAIGDTRTNTRSAYSERRCETPSATGESELRCPQCDYNLTGAPGERCPWCGLRIDAELLVQVARGRSGAARWTLGITAGVVGVTLLVVLTALILPRRALSLTDAFTVLGILVAAIAHLCLAGIVFLSRGQWPLRYRETGTIFRAIGWLAIVAGCFGASKALDVAPGTRGVEGVVTYGVLEFLLRAALFSMPGLTLLTLRSIAFRPWYGHRRPHNSEQAEDSNRSETDAPFTVDVLGRYDHQHVSWVTSNEKRPTTPAIDAAIARIWEAESALAETKDRDLHNGRLVRMVAVVADATALRFTLSETNYRDFLGTNLLGADSDMAQSSTGYADPLGISAMVVTTDGFVALGRRSHRVASHRGYLHPFGGMLEPTDLDESAMSQGRALAGSVIREVCEELGLSVDEVSGAVVIGIVRDRTIHQPELIFDVPIALSREELTRRFADTADDEHSDIEFAADDGASVLAFLETATRMTPVAEAGLLLHGRSSWGETWYEQTCMALYGTIPSQSEGRPPS